MANKNNNVSQDFETLKADISELRSDVSSITKKLIAMGKEQSEAAKQKAKLDTARLVNEFNSVVGQSTEQSKKAVESVGNKIAQKPVKSMALAFIAGVVLAKVFNNNNESSD